MALKKTFRYYYWIILEFLKKHFKVIIISSLVSFTVIIALISITPFFESYLSNKTHIIGLVGSYDLNNLPSEIYSKLSAGLVYVDERGDFQPALASTWDVRNNGKEYRFYLKKSLIWNDGKKFTAKDINYQFKDVKVNSINEYTIDFILLKPLLSFPIYLKKPIIRSPLIGVGGLYKINQIKSKFGIIQELSLEPNSKESSFLKYKFYLNENQLITAYKKGEITEASTTKKTIADMFNNWKNTKIIKTVDYTRLLTIFYNFNNTLIKEKDFRDAISKSIDRDQFKDLGEVAIGSVPPISWAFNSSLKSNLYDPDASEKIISKLITATGEGKLTIATYYDYYDIGDEINQSLKNIGLSPNIVISSFDKPSNFDLLIAYWKVPEDPDQYYFWHSTQQIGNIGNYKNVKIDKLLEDGRNTLSIVDRKHIYFEFQRILYDDPPAIFLFYPYVYTIQRK